MRASTIVTTPLPYLHTVMAPGDATDAPRRDRSQGHAHARKIGDTDDERMPRGCLFVPATLPTATRCREVARETAQQG